MLAIIAANIVLCHVQEPGGCLEEAVLKPGSHSFQPPVPSQWWQQNESAAVVVGSLMILAVFLRWCLL